MKIKTLEFQVEAMRTNGYIAVRATHLDGTSHEFYLVSPTGNAAQLSILSQEIIRYMRTGDAEKRIHLTATLNSITRLYLPSILRNLPPESCTYTQMPNTLD
jgi:hypothetical protein